MQTKWKVLFLCAGNSCRSQMAEGWARRLHPGRIEAYSAGVDADGLSPEAIQVMAEAGVNIARQQSKPATSLLHIPFDYVVHVCSPIDDNRLSPFRNAITLFSGFQDPARLSRRLRDPEEKLNCYRQVRDAIRDFIRTLPENLPARRRAAPAPQLASIA